MNQIDILLRKIIIQRILWVLVFMLPILFIWQDGDLTDTGYNMTIYHFFFERMDAGITESLIFLTEFIGASWLQIFPNYGIISIKILALLFFYLNIFLSKRIIDTIYPDHHLLPYFMLGAVMFSIRAFPIIFNYDLLTSFFLLLFVFLLRKKENSFTPLTFLLLGAISSLMVLARFPNIFLYLLFPVTLIALHVFGNIAIRWNRLFKLVLMFITGSFITFLAVYTILELLGWQEIYSNNFMAFIHIAAKGSETYTLSYVLGKYYMDFVYFMLYFGATAILHLICTRWAFKYFNSRWCSLIYIIGLVSLSLYPLVFNYNNSIKYILPSLVIIAWLTNLRSAKMNYCFSLIILISIIQIAGSNTGIFLKIGLLSVLAFPLALIHLKTSLKPNQIQGWLIPGIYTMLVSGMIHMLFIYGVGSGSNIRLEAVYPINHENYNLIYSTSTRAQYIEAVTADIVENLSPSQSLFIFGHQPMLYYTTNTAPALKEFWLVGNNLTSFPETFRQLSDKSMKPLFIDTKEDIFNAEVNKLKDKYLLQNAYELVKSTQFYDIWQAKN